MLEELGDPEELEARKEREDPDELQSPEWVGDPEGGRFLLFLEASEAMEDPEASDGPVELGENRYCLLLGTSGRVGRAGRAGGDGRSGGGRFRRILGESGEFEGRVVQ